ncbi:zinc finger and BTB domain-containing protein 37-like isoform X1 [Entelurus aequoreus]|uniref:zinc finger and BTB domain-containing protein 37-like isoform X1 n=1 Tax=Entelurus aequoreus TaxID=161455 RepID=UPI002B1E1FEE|nr:zinc finger and BTB domain-containing protein 37-like isoform X1 [Entelurus aequoreus]XP_061895333.1 zinc finger and BTB domain-containing protein 37 isoform X1 [Entelurus aequoreus]XP_061895461.1 zinc finger and BTB domain-containing protein 37-like isoform X1 [Entelurus aequoreus]
MERSGSIQLDIPDFSNSVLSHLNQLRVQGRLCDIVVHVQGQSFRAHKVVLAASSPYFRDHMSLSQMSTVSLTVIRNPSVFEQLLGFCYTGRLSLQLCDIISYLTAASFLQMQDVIDRCTHILEGIHLKISLVDPDHRPTDQEGVPPRPRTLEAPVRGARHPLPLGSSVDAASPGEETLSPTSGPCGPEQPGVSVNRAAKEPILRINRAGQWYVEAGSEADESSSVDGITIKTERTEQWIGTGREREEAGLAEAGGAMLIDVSGHGTTAPGTPGACGVRPSSSLGDADRFSPTGSVLVLADHPRAKSESPSRTDDPGHASSQGEEPAAYEDYVRDQAGDRWFRYNPRLTCIYCCKSFNQKGSLDRHMRLHMGITPFVCRLCGKKYTRKDQLEYHIRKHTGNKPFTCRLCAKSFPFQAILNQHLRKNHPGHDTHSASPETTTASLTSRGGPGDDASPGREETEAGGGGGAAYNDGPHPSVTTTGPD